MNNNLIIFLNTYSVVIFFTVIPLYIWRYEKKLEEAKHVVFAGILAFVMGLLFKEFLNMPRPFESDGFAAMAGQAISGSLPSIHTAVSFAMATTVSLHQRKTGIFLFLVAAIIGMARVAANVHYPVDIIVGAILGVITGFGIEKIHINK